MFKDIKEAKKAHKSFGGHFFDASAMRFFNSKIETKLIDGAWFVTSERMNLEDSKSFTVRKIKETGVVVDGSNFMEFNCLEDALIALGRAFQLGVR